jgi:XapX domain-containing protein
MRQILISFFTGLVMGGIFTILKLPVPAPGTLAGVAGVAGIFAGYLLIKFIR